MDFYKNGGYVDRRAITRALARRTPDASFPFHAGMIHAKLGDRAAHLAHALNLNPAFSPIDAPIAAANLAELGAQAAEAPSP